MRSLSSSQAAASLILFEIFLGIPSSVENFRIPPYTSWTTSSEKRKFERGRLCSGPIVSNLRSTASPILLRGIKKGTAVVDLWLSWSISTRTAKSSKPRMLKRHSCRWHSLKKSRRRTRKILASETFRQREKHPARARQISTES